MNNKNSKSSNKINNISKSSGISKLSEPYNPPKNRYKSSKHKSKSKKRKKYQSCKIINRFPNLKKKLREKLEEKEEIEFVLGDFKDFHKIEELQTFKNMTSLTLINESIKDISLIISNLPNPQYLYHLCLNQNEITNLDNIDKLENLQKLQINFNYIDKIPNCLFNLKKLKTFWACENNISVIENLPQNIESLWLANNYIENIPENFSELINLKQLNLAGNLISDLKDLYLISEIKTLEQIYLSDINFGENPICYFFNYRKIMINIFNYVEIIDQIKVTFEEKYDVNRYLENNIKNIHKEIKHNYRTCNMIFRLMKTYLFFYSSFQLYKIKVLSLRLKYLEYINKENNDNNNEIENLKFKIENYFEEYQNVKNNYDKLKIIIKELNDSFILYNIFKLETYNNLQIVPALPNTKSSLFCINLMESQLNNEFLKNNYYKSISFNEIYQIKNKKDKYIFNTLYNELIDENNKFGTENKFIKFLFIILPDNILQNKRKLFNFFTDNQKIEENFFFCDNISYLYEYEMNSDKYNYNMKNNNNISIICKCAYFESNVEVIDARFNFFNSIEEIKSYLVNLKSNSNKDIICLKIKSNVNFYIYNNRGLILPKYIIKYNFLKSNNSDFISCYSNNENDEGEPLNLKFNFDNEKLFNICSKHFFSQEYEKNFCNFINQKKIRKHQFSKFYEYNELDNKFFFFVKNSLIKFLNLCFKFNNKEEYFNEIKILNEKIKEINGYKIEENFLIKYDKYINEKEQNNNNFRKIKHINLLNQNITDTIFNDILKKISFDLTKSNIISIMTIKCEVLSLANNQLNEINLISIFDLFPNLQKLDLSHNKISSIIFFNTKEENNKFSALKYLDISYNNITDNNIIKSIKNTLKDSKIYDYGNPYVDDKSKKNKENNDIKQKMYKEKNKILFFEYISDFYSFTNELNNFKNLLYFKIIKKNSINRSFKDKILYLNNKNINSIQNSDNTNINIDENVDENIDENNIYNYNDYNIIYLNSNKLNEIKNLSNFINLNELYLQNNKIKTIEALPLTLKKLDLSFNYISNIDELRFNMNLELINLEVNNINKIKPLLNLSKLKKINCSNNLIDDISEDEFNSFNNLKFLDNLDFSGNIIVYSFEKFRLKIIYNCPNLKELNRKLVNEKERNEANDFFNGKLTIEVLEKRIKEKNEDWDEMNLNKLIELDLSGLSLKDEFLMFDMKKYPNLKKLNLSQNFFSSFEIFGFLPELSELNLSFNSFNEILPKKYYKNFKSRFNFSNLKNLDISNNKLSNIYGIQNFSKLRIINLKENYISKIDSLDKLNDLNYINITYNKLRACDKTNIGVLPSLKTFLCDNNYLKSINCFEKFSSLEYLSFNSNKITDMTCIDKLTQLKKLTKLSLIDNPITQIENYRKLIIFYFQKLKILDNIEIISKERIIDNSNNNSYNDEINSNFRRNFKRDEIIRMHNAFNESTKYQNMKSNIKNATKKLDYYNIGYRAFPFSKQEKKCYELKTGRAPKRSSGKNGTHTELNMNILKSKNDKDFDQFLFLSKRDKPQNNFIPALKLSNSKKYDEMILLNKNKNKSKLNLKRPYSGIYSRSTTNKVRPIIGKRNDYFSIVLNSFGNYDYTPLVTLKNFNVKKINF